MSNNLFQDGTDDMEQGFGPTGSKDSYGDRFEVIERSTTSKSHSPILKKYSNLKSSDRIFSRHRDKNANLGGHVNMKNVSRITVDNEEDDIAKNDSEMDDVFAQSDELNEEPTPAAEPGNEDIDKDPTQSIEVEQSDDSGLESLRSTGLDSLFSSTADNGSDDSPEATAKIKKTEDKDSQSKKNIFSKKPDTDNNKTKASKSPKDDLKRKVTVIRPVEFNSSASELSTALKNGDVVVLSIKHTNSNISNRILDFAFGCASITGANVSLEGEKTYVFTKGPAISDSERIVCINNGISLKRKKNK